MHLRDRLFHKGFMHKVKATELGSDQMCEHSSNAVVTKCSPKQRGMDHKEGNPAPLAKDNQVTAWSRRLARVKETDWRKVQDGQTYREAWCGMFGSQVPKLPALMKEATVQCWIQPFKNYPKAKMWITSQILVEGLTQPSKYLTPSIFSMISLGWCYGFHKEEVFSVYPKCIQNLI